MPLPLEDTVCRFVRRGEWSEREGRPRPGAFKQPELSFWHPGRLEANGVRLEALQFDSLRGSGQALLTVEQIHEAARGAEQKRGGVLRVVLEWRPETVGDAWRQWSYAHAEMEIEAMEEPPPEENRDGGLMSAFRMILCQQARCHPPQDPSPA